MSEDNNKRAERAKQTLEFYKHTALGESGGIEGDETLVDLLTDIHHLCGEKTVDEAISTAKGHYDAELKED